MSTAIKGVNRVLKNIKKAELKILKRTSRGLRAGAKFLKNESDELVPVETGDLKRSGYIANVEKHKGKLAMLKEQRKSIYKKNY